jgi:hypothetical protein
VNGHRDSDERVRARAIHLNGIRPTEPPRRFDSIDRLIEAVVHAPRVSLTMLSTAVAMAEHLF